MNKAIKEINTKLAEAKKTVRKLTNALEAMQDICEHDWRYQGHGHNDSLYECSLCGKEEFR